MNSHECIACGIKSWDDGWKTFYPIREAEPDEYEALCSTCAIEWMRCDCCGDAHQEVDLFTEGHYRDVVKCEDCIDRCVRYCKTLAERADHASMQAELRINKATWADEQAKRLREAQLAEEREREEQLSAVRESLRATLERQAKQN